MLWGLEKPGEERVIDTLRPNLPEGVKVLSCHLDEMPRRLVVVLTHESFAPVPEGEYPPSLGEEYSWWRHDLPSEEEMAMIRQSRLERQRAAEGDGDPLDVHWSQR